MTLCACPGALAWPGCPTCVWWEHSHVDNYESVTYLDVLQSCTDEA